MNRFAEIVWKGRGGNFSKAFLSAIGFLRKGGKKKTRKTNQNQNGEAQQENKKNKKKKQLKITAILFCFVLETSIKEIYDPPSPSGSFRSWRPPKVRFVPHLSNAAHLSSPKTAAILIIDSEGLLALKEKKTKSREE